MPTKVKNAMESISAHPMMESGPVRPLHPKVDQLDLTFSDSKAAYKSKTTGEIARALFVLSLCQSSFIVEHSRKLMKTARRLLGKTLFTYFMKKTFYGHFVAGENREAIKPVVNGMLTFGVKSILDYSAEEDLDESEAVEAEHRSCLPNGEDNPTHQTSAPYSDPNMNKFLYQEAFGDRRKGVFSARSVFYESEAECERHVETFLNCIDAVKDSTRGTGFAAIKLTALGKPQVLMQLSSALVQSRQFVAHLLDNGSAKPGYIVERKLPYEVFVNKMKLAGINTDDIEFQKWMRQIDYDSTGLIDLTKWSELLSKSFSLKDMFKLPIPSMKGGFQLLVNASEDDEERFKNMVRRIRVLCDYANKTGVRLMIDAEQSYFQPAISRIVLELMRRYNTEKNIIFNTYQCYLKDTDEPYAHIYH